MQFVAKILGSYVFILATALVLGFGFSGPMARLAPYVPLYLGVIFFLSGLRIDLTEIKGYLSDRPMLLAVNLVKLFLLPAAVFYITRLIWPDLAVAFLILAAMPAGMTSPLLAEIAGGKAGLALVFSISTSLLAPLTVPLVIRWLAGAEVQVSILAMFISLATIIFIPFLLAQAARYFWQPQIVQFSTVLKPLGMAFLIPLIATSIGKQVASTSMDLFSWQAVVYISASYLLFAVFHLAGWFTAFWRGQNDRVTITVCMAYINFGLAVYLADRFFTDPNIIVPIILSILPWATLLLPFKYLLRRR